MTRGTAPLKFGGAFFVVRSVCAEDGAPAQPEGPYRERRKMRVRGFCHRSLYMRVVDRRNNQLVERREIADAGFAADYDRQGRPWISRAERMQLLKKKKASTRLLLQVLAGNENP
jgi:hypothetical protein